MPTRDERAAALRQLGLKLGELGGRASGTPLRAADWNGLVSGVVELIRLGAEAPVDAAELENGSVKPEHLDPELRRDLKTDSGDQFALGERLTVLDKTLRSVSQRLSQIETRLAGLTSRIDDEATETNRRLTSLKLVEHQLEGALGLKSEVSGLRGVFDKLRDQMSSALKLSGQLVDERGNPVDLGLLRGRIELLEKFRGEWVDANGEAVGLSGLDLRLTDVQRAAVTKEEMIAAIEAHLEGRESGGLDLNAVDRRFAEQFDGRFALLNQSLREQISVRFDAERSSLSATLQGDLKSATEGLRAELTLLADSAASAHVKKAREELLVDLDARLDERLGKLGDVVGKPELDALAQRLDRQLSVLGQSAATRDELASAIKEAVGVETAAREEAIAALNRTRVSDLSTLRASVRAEQAAANTEITRSTTELIEGGLAVERRERAAALSDLAENERSARNAAIESLRVQVREERTLAINSTVQASATTIEQRVLASTRVLLADHASATDAEFAGLRRELGERVDKLGALVETNRGAIRELTAARAGNVPGRTLEGAGLGPGRIDR